MPGRPTHLSSRARRWFLALALLSFLGLYSIGLLPHHHPAGGELNCPICHVVGHLEKFTGDFGKAQFDALASPLKLLLILPSLRPSSAPHQAFFLLPPSR